MFLITFVHILHLIHVITTDWKSSIWQKKKKKGLIKSLVIGNVESILTLWIRSQQDVIFFHILVWFVEIQFKTMTYKK